MARTPRPKLDADSVTPLADLFGPALLQPLRQFIDQPRRREQADAHSNRRLLLSDLLVAQLLAFNHPTVRSLRLLDALSQAPVARPALAADRLPRFVLLSGRDGSECDAARRCVEPGRIYVGDRACFGFELLNGWLDGGADFAIAINTQLRFTPEASDTALPAAAPSMTAPSGAILSDRRGYLSGCGRRRPPTRRLREVILRRENGESLRLLTSLTDESLRAERIGDLYCHRWQIELFFRWLKSCAHFRHVISHSRNGLTTALCVALIGTRLTTIATGRPPSNYALTALQFVAARRTDLESMQPCWRASSANANWPAGDARKNAAPPRPGMPGRPIVPPRPTAPDRAARQVRHSLPPPHPAARRHTPRAAHSPSPTPPPPLPPDPNHGHPHRNPRIPDAIDWYGAGRAREGVGRRTVPRRRDAARLAGA